MILIVGTEDDYPSVYMQNKMHHRGLKTVMFDTTLYPKHTRISFQPEIPAKGFFQAGPNEPKVPFSDIQGVYRRWSKGVNAPHEDDPMLNEIVYWNIDSAIGSFCRVLDCTWVNPWESVEMHKYKGYQLQLLNAAGVRVPETLVTNDPDEVIAFYERLNKQVIYKPVRGWAHTTMLKDEDLSADRLVTLENSPIKLQEFVPGTDIRAYQVGKEMFAMEIQSSTLDFREEEGAKRVPITLPDTVLADCQKLAEVLELLFVGIDVRRTPDGEYVFFEGNPTPVFILDEQTTGYPISDRIIDMLVSGPPA